MVFEEPSTNREIALSEVPCDHVVLAWVAFPTNGATTMLNGGPNSNHLRPTFPSPPGRNSIISIHCNGYYQSQDDMQTFFAGTWTRLPPGRYTGSTNSLPPMMLSWRILLTNLSLQRSLPSTSTFLLVTLKNCSPSKRVLVPPSNNTQGERHRHRHTLD